MEKKFNFAIDCDEVLRHNNENMLKVYNKEFNDNKTVNDIFEFKVDTVFPRIQEELGMSASEYFFNLHSKEVFSDSKVIKDAKEAVDILREYGNVTIVTYQKNEENKARTLSWLRKNGIKYDGICFLRDKSLVRCDYMVDDNDWNFIGNNCKHGILIDMPYNHDKDLTEIKNTSNCETMQRFTSLKEFADWFKNNIENSRYFE